MWHYTRTENINSPTNGQPLGPRPLVPDLNILQWQSSGRGYGNVVFLGLSNQSLKRVQFFLGSVRQDIVDDTNDNPFFTPQTTGSNAGEYARRTGNALWNVFSSSAPTSTPRATSRITSPPASTTTATATLTIVPSTPHPELPERSPLPGACS